MRTQILTFLQKDTLMFYQLRNIQGAIAFKTAEIDVSTKIDKANGQVALAAWTAKSKAFVKSVEDELPMILERNKQKIEILIDQKVGKFDINKYLV